MPDSDQKASKFGRARFDLLDQEQLAAQLVAIMDAHFQRPSAGEKRHILRLAADQITGAVQLGDGGSPSPL
jgi:hypothetical protein